MSKRYKYPKNGTFQEYIKSEGARDHEILKKVLYSPIKILEDNDIHRPVLFCSTLKRNGFKENDAKNIIENIYEIMKNREIVTNPEYIISKRCCEKANSFESNVILTVLAFSQPDITTECIWQCIDESSILKIEDKIQLMRKFEFEISNLQRKKNDFSEISNNYKPNNNTNSTTNLHACNKINTFVQSKIDKNKNLYDLTDDSKYQIDKFANIFDHTHTSNDDDLKIGLNDDNPTFDSSDDDPYPNIQGSVWNDIDLSDDNDVSDFLPLYN